MTEFIGREEELKTLRGLLKKKSASFVVIRGRRRIGKSRLIQEFGKRHRLVTLVGLPPGPDTTQQGQLDEFLTQMSRSFQIPLLQAKNWGDALWLTGQQCGQGRIILALDEISWIASKDPCFLGQLKNAWDLHFSRNPQLILIVAGSVSSWIEDNILNSTGFVGRISVDMCLRELPIQDIGRFWSSHHSRTSKSEQLKILSVTGGVPRYLEEVRTELSADENIRRMCFQEDGLLFREFDQIFSEVFSKSAPRYADILTCLSSGAHAFEEISQIVSISSGGSLSDHLRNLRQGGFITEDASWNLHSGKNSRAKRYRLSDNYSRFYLRCVLPNQERVREDLLDDHSLTGVQGWNAIVGLQFENLVLNNKLRLLQVLSIPRSDVVNLGPFFQRPTQRAKGCQIDLLIQARQRIVYLCEIKFSTNPVGMSAVRQLERAASRIALPRGHSTRLVLIHAGGVTRDVAHTDRLDAIVDFGSLMGGVA